MKTSKAVSVYLMGCEARGLAKATVDQYRWALLRMVADCRGIPKRGKNLLPALADQSLSQETRNDLIKCWRTFFRCYVRQDWPSNRVLANPVEELDALPYRRRIPGVLKRQEVCKLLTVANTERDRMMVLLVMDCGLRVRELASLRWTDVRDDHLVVNGKVGDRVVPISRSIRDQLESQGNGFHVWMGETRSFNQGRYQAGLPEALCTVWHWDAQGWFTLPSAYFCDAVYLRWGQLVGS